MLRIKNNKKKEKKKRRKDQPLTKLSLDCICAYMLRSYGKQMHIDRESLACVRMPELLVWAKVGPNSNGQIRMDQMLSLPKTWAKTEGIDRSI